MSFEEEFDKIIRQKSEEAKYPFDEKNWEKVSSMLDAERKATGSIFSKKFYVAGLLLLLAGSIGFIAIDSMTGKPGITLAADETKALRPEVPADNINNAIQKNNLDVKAEKNTLADLSLRQVKKTMAVNEAPVTDVAAEKTVMDKPNVNIPETINESGSIASNNTAETKAEPALSPEQNAIADKNMSPASEQPLAPASLAKTSEQEQAPAMENKIPDEITTNEIIPAEAVAVQYEPLNYISTSLPGEDNELMPTTFAMLRFYDEDYYKRKRNKIQYLNVEAGAAYLAGWDATGGKDGKGLNWFFGLNYGIYLSKKLSVGLGAQLYNIAHISQPFFTQSKTQYDFGSSSTHTMITAQSMYYAAVPLKLSYAINKQSQFGVGFNMGFLINSQNKVQTYAVSDVKVNPTSAANTGVYKGMANTNMMVSVFYKTQLAKRLALNGEVIYGLSDLFANTNTIKNNERAMGLRLSLQYALFDR